MPVSLSSIYRTREDILAGMISQLQSAIPDVYVGDDGVIRIIFDIEAGQFESLYLAEQLLLEDMFITTAAYQALIRYGDQYGLPMFLGARSEGTLLFTGDDGVFIPQGTLAAYDPGNGLDPVYFETTDDATVPAPGDPTPPIVSKTDGGGTLTGAYEYVVTFTTAQGETLPSVESQIVTVTAGTCNLSNIPIGGPQTLGRRIYRDLNGAGNFRLVREFAENTTVVFVDNVTDATIVSAQTPPTVDTAHAIPVGATAQNVGVEGNIVVGAVTIVSDGPAGLTGVTNGIPFTGGADEEDSETYRARLLDFIRNPQTGSVSDLEAWAKNVPGVETVTVQENTPANGTVTVRITGPNGSIAPPETITAVQQQLDSLDYANITIIVSSFTPVSTDITVNVTEDPSYTLAQITPAVQSAIANYINNLEVGGTLYVSGIVDSAFGLPGVIDVVVTTPSANQVTAANSKRVANVITVT